MLALDQTVNTVLISLKRDLTLSNIELKARDAASFLENQSFKDAVDAMNGYLDAKMLSSKLLEGEAERLILSKQLLAGIVRELNRAVTDGVVEEFNLREVEPIKREFRR